MTEEKAKLDFSDRQKCYLATVRSITFSCAILFQLVP